MTLLDQASHYLQAHRFQLAEFGIYCEPEVEVEKAWGIEICSSGTEAVRAAILYPDCRVMGGYFFFKNFDSFKKWVESTLAYWDILTLRKAEWIW